jgi:spoIIIJ-associated protein
MPEIVREAKTIEAAIEEALAELGCSRENARIEIIQEPVKGIFGMAKMAKVRVNYEAKPKWQETEVNSTEQISPEKMREATQKGQNLIKKIITYMGIQNAKIKTSEEENTITLDIHCDSEGLIIGRHGQTLASLQYLVNRIAHHTNNKRIRYIVDVGGYKNRHKSILEKMAKRIAQKVINTKEEEQLKSMSAYDRRIIHLAIKSNPEVTTYSLGEGNFRRVVIAPRAKPDETDK